MDGWLSGKNIQQIAILCDEANNSVDCGFACTT